MRAIVQVKKLTILGDSSKTNAEERSSFY